MPEPTKQQRSAVARSAKTGRYVKRALTSKERELFDALDRDLAPGGMYSKQVAARQAARADRDATIMKLVDGK